MRNGILLAEDTPQNIMTLFNSSTLEDAFLILSQRQLDEADVTVQQVGHNSESEQTTRRDQSFAEQNPQGILEKLLFTSKNRMKALLTKNVLQIFRQKMLVWTIRECKGTNNDRLSFLFQFFHSAIFVSINTMQQLLFGYRK